MCGNRPSSALSGARQGEAVLRAGGTHDWLGGLGGRLAALWVLPYPLRQNDNPAGECDGTKESVWPPNISTLLPPPGKAESPDADLRAAVRVQGTRAHLAQCPCGRWCGFRRVFRCCQWSWPLALCFHGDCLLLWSPESVLWLL